MYPDGDVRRRQRDETLPNRPVDEFFVKLNRGLRRPKPGEQEVAQAIEAIQKLTQQASLREKGEHARPITCPNCGATNLARNRFCGYCGARLGTAHENLTPPVPHPPDEHRAPHQQYSYFSRPSQIVPHESSSWETSETDEEAAEPGLDAERAIPKLVENWSRLFNARNLEGLVALYSADAIVLRSQSVYVQGSAAIRQLFQATLAGGTGECELGCDDLGVAGEIACLAGHILPLAPLGSAREQEAIGKYLLVLRHEGGAWKIVADSWSMNELRSSTAEVGDNSREALPRIVSRSAGDGK